jgi:DNA processing protein
MSAVCASCAARAELVAALAPRIDAALTRRAGDGPEVLRLSDRELTAAFGEPPPSARTNVPVEVACRHAREFPGALHELDAIRQAVPAAIYVVGGLELLTELLTRPVVTIVGGRRASAYALDAAYDLGRSLAVSGVTVVSGLALGIDAAAHRGALDGGGSAIAVVACGPDVAYPRTNRGLRDRVAEQGVIVSEMPPGTPAFRWAFPARNRIMAALAQLTIVVECRERSGTLITCRFASDLGRDVGAVPGRIDSVLAAGSNALLQDCQVVVTSAEAVLDNLFGVAMGPLGLREPTPPLDPGLQSVLELAVTGAGPGSIGAALGMDPGAVRVALARLEQRGLLAPDGLGGHRPG